MLFPLLLLISLLLPFAAANPIAASSSRPSPTPQCRKTKVAILGAGVAGITAAQTLHNASISDFLIVDVNSYVGGRVAHTAFGTDPSTGKPYTVELGANWVQGLGSQGGPENPIWRLSKKWGIKNTYSDFDSLRTFDGTGEIVIPDEMWEEWEEGYAGVEKDAGEILVENLQDRSMRAQLRINGWKPKPTGDNWRQAIEWYDFDFEYAYPAEQSSTTWSVVNYNTTFYQFSEENNFVHDQRGFSHFLVSEAGTFLKPNDPRLLLSTNVTKIDYSAKDSVTISTANGTCVQADYTIVTFSLGVLQAEIVEFAPELPDWKVEAIESMQMGTYTKIFMQFPPNANGTYFWDPAGEGTQFFLYADPEERGYYPLFQSLETPTFLPGSGIFFVTVVSQQSYIVESQSYEKTKGEVLDILRRMFGEENVPEPLDFMYPRWSQEDWARGSYSNWPTGLSIETHQNLRADIGDGKVWWAGEAGSVEFFGFLQGAYDEGRLAASALATCIRRGTKRCHRPRYETVKGCTTSQRMLVEGNGWYGGTFETWGLQEKTTENNTGGGR